MTADLTNIMEHIKVEVDLDFEPYDIFKGSVTFCWNDEDDQVDKIMTNDFTGDLRKMEKKSMMWIEEVKEDALWIEGEKLWITIKNKGDYSIAFWETNENSKLNKYADVVIEPNGYCLMRHFNHYSWCDSLMIRVNSIYNDNISQQVNLIK